MGHRYPVIGGGVPLSWHASSYHWRYFESPCSRRTCQEGAFPTIESPCGTTATPVTSRREPSRVLMELLIAPAAASASGPGTGIPAIWMESTWTLIAPLDAVGSTRISPGTEGGPALKSMSRIRVLGDR